MHTGFVAQLQLLNQLVWKLSNLIEAYWRMSRRSILVGDLSPYKRATAVFKVFHRSEVIRLNQKVNGYLE